MSLRLSEKHGVNPSLEQCFYCMKDKGLVLFGRLPEDQEAPTKVCVNREPCEECKGYMAVGVILISVRSPAERMHACTDCKHTWLAVVRRAKETSNISGIESPECPVCQSRNVAVSPGDVEDPENPYRTGGWVVVRDDVISRVVEDSDLRERILKARVAFLPDEVWDILGLPRGEAGGEDTG